MTGPARYATEPDRGLPLPPLALALSLLVGPLGIVLGIVALRRAHRNGEPGARTAVAAIAVGTVVTVLYAALVVTLLVLFVLVRDTATPLPPGLSAP